MSVQEMLKEMPNLAPEELKLVGDELYRLRKEAWEEEILAESAEIDRAIERGEFKTQTIEEVLAELDKALESK